MQIIVEVEVEAGVYASDQYQSRIKAPSVCPACGIAQSLEAHGYYWRWVSSNARRNFIEAEIRVFNELSESCDQHPFSGSFSFLGSFFEAMNPFRRKQR